MKTVLDTFEQSLEDTAEQFAPLSDAEKTEVETIINAANKSKNADASATPSDRHRFRRAPQAGRVR